MTAFPPRLPEQPIFYPVLNAEYAIQIARDWNTRSESRAGYVTRFEVDDNYASRFEPHIVGSRQHEELWIPAEQLDAFNGHITGKIEVVEAFFGEGFRGYMSEGAHDWTGNDAVEQFVLLEAIWGYNAGKDFPGEIAANPKPIFLHFLFWTQHDFYPEQSITAERRDEILRAISSAWDRAFGPDIVLCYSGRYRGAHRA
jgi:hypothetical protein